MSDTQTELDQPVLERDEFVKLDIQEMNSPIIYPGLVPDSVNDIKAVDWKNRPGFWDERDLTTMLLANKTWITKTQLENPDYFKMNKAGHFPKVLWIGCVDARVPANELVGEHPGSMLVHRNIANQVISTDMNTMSVIQFAVEYYGVKHIIVCGHYDCGGCKAAMERMDHGSPLENWICGIRDVYRLHKAELSDISDVKERLCRLTELNVVEQCINLYKTVHVQRARMLTSSTEPFRQPQIHGVVFDPTTGELRQLDVVKRTKSGEHPKQLEELEEEEEMLGVYGLFPQQSPGAPSKPSTDESGSASASTPLDEGTQCRPCNSS